MPQGRTLTSQCRFFQHYNAYHLPETFARAPTSAFDGNWLAMMTALVEDTYQLNNQTKVTLLSHSMGCLYTLWFLNQKPQVQYTTIHKRYPTGSLHLHEIKSKETLLLF